MLIEITVYCSQTKGLLGNYYTTVIPREGEILDTNRITYKVDKIQHDICGVISLTTEPLQKSVIVYVTSVFEQGT